MPDPRKSRAYQSARAAFLAAAPPYCHWCRVRVYDDVPADHPLKATVDHRIEVDTAFFKGNYPDRCSVQAAYVTGGTDRSITTQSMFWQTLLPEQKLEMDAIHTFTDEVARLGPIDAVDQQEAGTDQTAVERVPPVVHATA